LSFGWSQHALQYRGGWPLPNRLFDNLRGSGRPFLKEFVKRVRFPSGNLRKGSARRDRLFWLIVDPLRLVAGLDSFWSSSLREVAIVLFNARLLPNHSFARRRSRYARAALPSSGRR
jgi:hypothetical protein